MLRRPPRVTRTDTRFPSTTLVRSQQVLELARRVVGVEDRKTAPQTGFRVLDLRQLQAQRVEGADRQPLRAVAADALGDALAHFLCRLVGEGEIGRAHV